MHQQSEEILVKLVFGNEMLFCSILGALGGVVHSIDISSNIDLRALVNKIIVSASAGLLLFFSTYDLTSMTPAWRLAAAIVCGFYGSALFKHLARFYIHFNTTLGTPHESLVSPIRARKPKKAAGDVSGDGCDTSTCFTDSKNDKGDNSK